VESNAWEWFARRTYRHEQFSDLGALASAKFGSGTSVSVCLPTRNEAGTIGRIVRFIRRELVEGLPLVDEILVMDGGSTDETASIAADEGAVVVQERDVLPHVEPASGKGEALWKSLFACKGDLIVFLDTDNQRFHPRFVYGLLGPLLLDPEIGYVKAFYERPIRDERRLHATGGGRVTELLARPLINLFWPHLSAFIQPLAGEYAGRRSVLELVPFFTGYAVELGLLVDISERWGLDTLAQVDLDRRVHRNHPIEELSRMSFAILQAAIIRLSGQGRVAVSGEMNHTLHQFRKKLSEYHVEMSVTEVLERPAAVTVPGYAAGRG
jgi:glucosyl-3-phosphoglycerate synthase